MWPMLLDMTEEESIQSLRHLELEAYSSLVSALRAQGSLNQDKRRILKETSILLHISSERHKAEVRRAISDEKLNTIAYHIAGRLNSLEDWAQEGRRLVPLLPRTPPQTPYSIVADDASDAATQYNKQLPYPANTERKRVAPQSVGPTINSTDSSAKPLPFRVPEVPKDETKKRKCHNVGENSSLAQQLLGTKLTKIQQIYRQASRTLKQKVKDALEIENADVIKSTPSNFPQVQQLPPPVSTSKINIIQNISIPANERLPLVEEKRDTTSNPMPVNENQAPVSKTFGVKSNNNLAAKQSTSSYANDAEQAINPAKLCITKKTINKGQKLIVVSNAQTLPTSSILQKTLSVPRSKLTKLNVDKYKIVSNNQLPSTLQVTNTVTNQNTLASKPKLVTIKGSSGKKVIPLSQLQMLNPKGNLKVVPYSGVIEKNASVSNARGNKYKRAALPVYNSNLEDLTHSASAFSNILQIEELRNERHRLDENREQSIEDFESEITEFELNSHELELDSGETASSESSEVDDRTSNGNSDDGFAMEMDGCEILETRQDNELLEEFEVVHTEKLLQ